MTIDAILAEVAVARREIDATVRRDWPAERWLAALGERVGGVCQAVVRGGHDADLWAALVEVAAVCGAWYEAIGYDTSFNALVATAAPMWQRHAYLSGLITLFARLAAPVLHGMLLVDCAAVAVAWAASLGRPEEVERRGCRT